MTGKDIIGTFNVGGDPSVDTIKQKSAELIDLILGSGKCARRNAIAITAIEQAQMMAVKSIYTKETK